MGCSAEYMHFQLVHYMQTYIKGVKILGERLLAAEDFIAYISQQNNHGDELSLYLLSRMVQKHLGVIGHDNIWYTSHCKTGQINVEDCHIVLVYLGGGGRLLDTKWISVLSHTPPTLKHKNLSSGEEYEPEVKVVYDLEVKKRHTQSMGIISTESSESSSGSKSKSSEGESSLSELLLDTEPASEPEVPKPKPKTHHSCWRNLALTLSTLRFFSFLP